MAIPKLLSAIPSSFATPLLAVGSIQDSGSSSASEVTLRTGDYTQPPFARTVCVLYLASRLLFEARGKTVALKLLVRRLVIARQCCLLIHKRERGWSRGPGLAVHHQRRRFVFSSLWFCLSGGRSPQNSFPRSPCRSPAPHHGPRTHPKVFMLLKREQGRPSGLGTIPPGRPLCICIPMTPSCPSRSWSNSSLSLRGLPRIRQTLACLYSVSSGQL
ncbi:uncharacterized protein C8Q71DRAFT_556835 [Rhodofomes roseus]|uniref:Secreted protein n=1 Tax=Rhodofomes roseus TaxID=34475 RepID=A0ABQ8KIA5_9APHY|nr:uncharacterized protein C8Q71DRAFT_556835 [Rhodofomes roseus]KAH9837696.1 hypothetical protein C8Q71DRAFT_556835 [Rhodofomes roseus]